MKNFRIIFCLASLLSSPSYATGFYAGVDAISSNSRHVAKEYSSSSSPKNTDNKNDNKISYGANLGFRVDFINLMTSAEIFYDDISTSSKNFSLKSGASNSSDSIRIENRYGAKANVGLKILPGVAPFLTYGLANVNHSSNVLSNNHMIRKSEMTPLYGVGVLIDLPLSFSLKATYDYQQFNMDYAEPGTKIRTNLAVARIGVMYNF